MRGNTVAHAFKFSLFFVSKFLSPPVTNEHLVIRKHSVNLVFVSPLLKSCSSSSSFLFASNSPFCLISNKLREVDEDLAKVEALLVGDHAIGDPLR